MALIPATTRGFALDQLAPELQHMVFAAVDVRDVPSLRLTCESLGAVGLEYLVPDMEILCTQKSSDRLREISEHPILSRHVESLEYCVGCLPRFRDIDHWYIHIPEEVHDQFNDDNPSLPEPPAFDDDYDGAEWRYWLRRNRPMSCLDHSTQEWLSDVWYQYMAMYEEQQDFHAKESIGADLIGLMSKLSSLKHIAFSSWQRDQSEPYSDILVDLQGGPTVSQLLWLLRGINHGNLSIATLQYDFVGHKVHLNNECIDLAEKALKSLTSLKTENLHADNGQLIAFFRTMPSLRVLDISLNISWDTKTKHVFGDLFWPYLRRISVRGLRTTPQDLIDFISRHAATLEVLQISYCYMHKGRWLDVWPMLRERSYLQEFKIKGSVGHATDAYVPECECHGLNAKIVDYVLRAAGTEDYTAQDFCKYHSQKPAGWNQEAEP
ncbi:MAG: hypothetical protein Q9169_004735 [Polycauliona sp. 2 TL-2023]